MFLYSNSVGSKLQQSESRQFFKVFDGRYFIGYQIKLNAQSEEFQGIEKKKTYDQKIFFAKDE